MIESLLILLVLFQLKHFLADYPLQRPWMLGKFKEGWGFVPPLLAHVSVHGLLTYLIVRFWTGDVRMGFCLAALDMTIHFMMDRLKAGPRYMGRWKPLNAEQMARATKFAWKRDIPDLYGPLYVGRFYGAQLRGNTLFWWSLGLDQMVHHLTHYLIIYLLLS